MFQWSTLYLRVLPGGSFHSKSASIELTQFSYFAVGTTKLPRQRYYSQVLYKLKQPHEWDVLLVVTKDDPAFQQVIAAVCKMIVTLYIIHFVYTVHQE